MPDNDREFTICGGPRDHDIWLAIRDREPTRVPFRLHPLDENAEETDAHAKFFPEKLVGGIWIESINSLQVTYKLAGLRMQFYWVPKRSLGTIILPAWAWEGLVWS